MFELTVSSGENAKMSHVQSFKIFIPEKKFFASSIQKGSMNILKWHFLDTY